MLQGVREGDRWTCHPGCRLTNAHRVKTQQINKRGDGGGGKGLRFDDLPDRSGDVDEDDLEEGADED